MMRLLVAPVLLMWGVCSLLMVATFALWRGGEVQGAWLYYVHAVDGQIYRRWVDPAAGVVLAQETMTTTFGTKQNLSAAPDGQWLVFSVFNAGYYNLAKMRFNGRDLQPLTNRDAWDTLPAWSPDNQWIAFTSDLDKSAELYWMRPDASGLERLTDNEAYDTAPVWSPDSRTLLFQSTFDGNPELYVRELGNDHIRRLTTHPRYDGKADWSPDGQWIVFVSDRLSNDAYHIYKMYSDGSHVTLLTDPTSQAGFYDPRWSPNGEWITFWGGQAGNFIIYVMRSDGSDLRAITRPSSYTGPEWVPLVEKSWSGWSMVIAGVFLGGLGICLSYPLKNWGNNAP